MYTECAQWAHSAYILSTAHNAVCAAVRGKYCICDFSRSWVCSVPGIKLQCLYALTALSCDIMRYLQCNLCRRRTGVIITRQQNTFFLRCKNFCGKTALNASPLASSSHTPSSHLAITTLYIFSWNGLTEHEYLKSLLKLFNPIALQSESRQGPYLNFKSTIFSSKATSC